MFLSKYAVARHIYIPIIKRSVVDFAVSADWTPAAGDVKISIDGGAAANVTNLPTAITMGNGAVWDFSLTSGEVTGKQIVITVVDAATKAVEDQSFVIETYGNALAQHIFDLGTATQKVDLDTIKTQAVTCAGGVTVPAATLASTTNITAATGIDVTKLLGTAWLAPGTAGTPDVNVKLWNALTTVALPLVPTTAGRTLDVSVGGEAGVDWANVGSPTTTLALTGTTIAVTQKVDVDTIKTNPVVNAGTVTFPTNATLASTTNITAGTIATVTNLTNAPTSGDLTATMKASVATATWTDTTAGDFTTALSIGKSVMNGVALGTGLTINDITTKTGYSLSGTQTFNNTGTWTGNIVGTLSTLTTYTGNTPQTGDAFARLGAPAGASTAVDIAAINTKTTNLPAAPASTTNITAAAGVALTSAYDFAKGTVAMTESYAANTVAPTPAQALFAIQQHLMDFAIAGTSYTVYKLDHVTTAYIGTLDSAVTPTSQLRT